VTEVHLEEGEIRCMVPDDAIPAITRRLVEAGVEVRAVVPRRSLEEYFLHLTEGASDVAPVHRTGKEGGA
jgi:hypothetical protein